MRAVIGEAHEGCWWVLGRKCDEDKKLFSVRDPAFVFLKKKILFSFIVVLREEMPGLLWISVGEWLTSRTHSAVFLLPLIVRYGSTPVFPEDRWGRAVLWLTAQNRLGQKQNVTFEMLNATFVHAGVSSRRKWLVQTGAWVELVVYLHSKVPTAAQLLFVFLLWP